MSDVNFSDGKSSENLEEKMTYLDFVSALVMAKADDEVEQDGD